MKSLRAVATEILKWFDDEIHEMLDGAGTPRAEFLTGLHDDLTAALREKPASVLEGAAEQRAEAFRQEYACSFDDPQYLDFLEGLQETEREAFRAGYARALERFAWWKDGVQYVGTTGTTLAEALARIEDS